jgi:hypothetical protein
MASHLGHRPSSDPDRRYNEEYGTADRSSGASRRERDIRYVDGIDDEDEGFDGYSAEFPEAGRRSGDHAADRKRH